MDAMERMAAAEAKRKMMDWLATGMAAAAISGVPAARAHWQERLETPLLTDADRAIVIEWSLNKEMWARAEVAAEEEWATQGN